MQACEPAIALMALVLVMVGVAFWFVLFLYRRLGYNTRIYFRAHFDWETVKKSFRFGVFEMIGAGAWGVGQSLEILITQARLVPSYPLFAFLYAFFGGWDDETLEEVHRTVALSSFMKPLAWLFWAASVQGARINPLHGRFPISIRAEALLEAKALEEERVSLI